jgi:hypothetical protein
MKFWNNVSVNSNYIYIGMTFLFFFCLIIYILSMKNLITVFFFTCQELGNCRIDRLSVPVLKIAQSVTKK